MWMMFIFTIYIVIPKQAYCYRFFYVWKPGMVLYTIKVSDIVFPVEAYSWACIRVQFVTANANCVQNPTFWKHTKDYGILDTFYGWLKLYVFIGFEMAFVWDFRILDFLVGEE